MLRSQKRSISKLLETARKWPRAEAPVSAHRISAARTRFRRPNEQQELGHNFVDKLVEQKIGEEAAPAVRRDETGPITLFRTAAESRRGPTGELGVAALDRAASEARAAAADIPEWDARRPSFLRARAVRCAQCHRARELHSCYARLD